MLRHIHYSHCCLHALPCNEYEYADEGEVEDDSEVSKGCITTETECEEDTEKCVDGSGTSNAKYCLPGSGYTITCFADVGDEVGEDNHGDEGEVE